MHWLLTICVKDTIVLMSCKYTDREYAQCRCLFMQEEVLKHERVDICVKFSRVDILFFFREREQAEEDPTRSSGSSLL